MRARGERLRSRRRLLAALAAPVLLLAVAVLAALVMGDEGDRTTVEATAGSARQAVTSIVSGDATSSLPRAPTSTTAPSPVVPATPPSTVVPRTTTTATGGALLSAAEPPTTTTTTTAPPPSGCGADAFAIQTVTDKATYRPGEAVNVTSTLTNTGPIPCHIGSYNFFFHVEDAGGATVSLRSVAHYDFMQEPLRPSEQWTNRSGWDQRICGDSGASCSPAPPGTYTVVAEWGVSAPAPPASRVTIRISAA